MTCTWRVAVAGTAIGVLAAVAPAQNERRFAKDFETVHELMDEQKWQEALDLLKETLAKNEDEDYVRFNLWEIQFDVLICEFHLATPATTLKRAFEGEIEELDPETGRIAIAYDGKNMDDFGQSEKPSLHGYPLWFFEDVKLTIKSKNYPNYRAGFRIGLSSGYLHEGILFEAGRYDGDAVAYDGPFPARLEDERLEIARAASPWRGRNEFEISLHGTKDKLWIANGEDIVLEVPRPPGLFEVTFAQGEYDSIRIEGQAKPESLRSVTAAHYQRQYVEFLADYKFREKLPAWIFRTPQVDAPPTQVGQHEPNLAGSESRVMAEAMNLARNGDPHEALTVIDKAKGRSGRDYRSWVRAIAYLRAREPEDALHWARDLKRSAKRFAEGRMLGVVALQMLGRRTDAAKELESILKERPDYLDGYVALVNILAELGRHSDAREWLAKARALGMTGRGLAEYEVLLQLALKGPRWDVLRKHETEHYDIFTNMDGDIGSWAGEILENSYERYHDEVAPARRQKGDRYQVFIFASQFGYIAHNAVNQQMDTASALGHFDRAKRQLMLFNHPNRADMEGTIRHEGFHQYLHSVDVFVPRWLNEGLAEYYESFGPEGLPKEFPDRWVTHLKNLRRKKEKVLPAEDLLVMSEKKFFEDTFFSYSQGWAFIHFLKSDEERAKWLDTVLRLLRRGTWAGTALKKTFQKVDMEQLDADYKAHVDALFEKHVPAKDKAALEQGAKKKTDDN